MTNSVRVDKLHLAMLKRLNIQSENGVPTVDDKRPYGNKNIIQDLIEIYNAELGYELIKIEDDGGFLLLDGNRVVARGGQFEAADGNEVEDQDLQLFLERHHREMDAVLSILLQDLTIQEGVYSRPNSWARQGWSYQGIGEDAENFSNGSRNFQEYADEQKAGWTEDQKAVYDAAARALSAEAEKPQPPRGPRRVAVAIASSLTSTDQDYVDLALSRHIREDDILILNTEAYNNRIRTHRPSGERITEVPSYRGLADVDFALAIYDPCMDTENDANRGPKNLQLWAQDNGIRVIQEEARAASTPSKAPRDVK